MRALIVEDDPTTGAAWSRALKSAGFECDLVERVSDAMQSVLSQNHDLYLLDLIVKNDDTTGLTKLIKYRHPTKPILVVTGSSWFPKAEHAQMGSIDWILRKPVPSADLEAIALYLTSADHSVSHRQPEPLRSAG